MAFEGDFRNSRKSRSTSVLLDFRRRWAMVKSYFGSFATGGSTSILDVRIASLRRYPAFSWVTRSSSAHTTRVGLPILERLGSWALS